MENRRQRLQLSQPELRILLDLCSKELIRQITHNTIDPDLVNLVKKAAKALATLKPPPDTQEPTDPTPTP